MTIGNPAFCLALYLTGVHFRGELQHVDHVGKQKIKCQPIRTRKIAGVKIVRQTVCMVAHVFMIQNEDGGFQFLKYALSLTIGSR